LKDWKPPSPHLTSPLPLSPSRLPPTNRRGRLFSPLIPQFSPSASSPTRVHARPPDDLSPRRRLDSNMATMDPQFTHAKLLEAASLLRLPVGVLVERLELTPDVFSALPAPPPPRHRVNANPDARATSRLDGPSLAHDTRPSSFSWPLDLSQTPSPGTGSSGPSLETWSDPSGLLHPHVPPRVRMTAATPPPPSPSGRANAIHSDWVHVMSRVTAAASLPRDAASNGSDVSGWVRVRDGSPISSATLVTATADHVSPRFVSPMHSRRTSPGSHPEAGRTPESQPSSAQPDHAADSDSQGLVWGGHYESALTGSRGGSGSPVVGKTPSLGPCSKVWELPPVGPSPLPVKICPLNGAFSEFGAEERSSPTTAPL
jgi:hypothetical protein